VRQFSHCNQFLRTNLQYLLRKMREMKIRNLQMRIQVSLVKQQTTGRCYEDQLQTLEIQGWNLPYSLGKTKSNKCSEQILNPISYSWFYYYYFYYFYSDQYHLTYRQSIMSCRVLRQARNSTQQNVIKGELDVLFMLFQGSRFRFIIKFYQSRFRTFARYR